MSVYIEYAVCDNLIVDYLLLRSTFFLIGQKVKKTRIFLTAILGTVTAVTLPLCPILKWIKNFLKILLAVVMIFLCGEYKSVRGYFLTLGIFLALTFVSGGATIAIFYALDMSYVINGTISYDAELPLSVIILTVFIITKLCLKLGKTLYKKKSIFPFLRKCELKIKGKTFFLTGFIDSGNRLFEKKTGYPIIVIAEKNFYKTEIYSYVGKPYSKVSFSTVAGQGEMLVYSVDEIVIYAEEKIVYNYVFLGVGLAEYKDEYDLILHPAISGV